MFGVQYDLSCVVVMNVDNQGSAELTHIAFQGDTYDPLEGPGVKDTVYIRRCFSRPAAESEPHAYRGSLHASDLTVTGCFDVGVLFSYLLYVFYNAPSITSQGYGSEIWLHSGCGRETCIVHTYQIITTPKGCRKQKKVA